MAKTFVDLTKAGLLLGALLAVTDPALSAETETVKETNTASSLSASDRPENGASPTAQSKPTQSKSTQTKSASQPESTSRSESTSSRERPPASQYPSGTKIVPQTGPPGFVERIDRRFEVAVNWLMKILFYRVGSSQRQYVVVSHKEYYIRKPSSERDFRRLGSQPGNRADAEVLTSDEIRLLAAEGRIRSGAQGKRFRVGKLDGRRVEYVTVTFNDTLNGHQVGYQTKYVQTEGDPLWHKVMPKRGLIMPEKTLRPAQVENLAQRGWLTTNPQKAVSPERPWILSEPVGGAPVVVLWLAFGAVFFTLFMGFFNVWGFRHAVEIVRGKYDNPKEQGEVTHFQALSSALSATVGLGNIAGVTIAMTLGGPGAFFWMVVCGLFGMSSKFTECTLGQKYRLVKPDGTVLGGPMRYLHVGLKEMKLGPLGLILSLAFTLMCILASFGGGNMFQANQSGTTLLSTIQEEELKQRRQLDQRIRQAAAEQNIQRVTTLQDQRQQLDQQIQSFQKNFRVGYGLVLAFLVAVVIIGGIRRIGAAAEKIVPSMCVAYILACLWIILTHITQVPELVGTIVGDAFSGRAMGGGFLGVLVIGVQRGAFSNEAGVGSAPIAHSAARTDKPIREGAVALLEPFIDTVVVCSMTALVILITGAWENNAWIIKDDLEGAQLTARAFGEEISWFPWILSVAVVLFAYSTIISWAYYGERSWERLFGPRSTILYKVLAVVCVFIGSVVNLGAVLDFADMMILSMAFPNILGVALLAPKVRRDLMEYWRSYRAGEFPAYK